MDYNLLKVLMIISFVDSSIAYNNSSVSDFESTETKVLSRTKRFLVYPDGSSFQLVICSQNMGYLRLNIVWFGNTAALAWELPTDPSIFHIFKGEGKLYNLRRQDSKHIVYLDEDGKVLSAVPYHRKLIVNPAFAKRSVDSKIKNVLTRNCIKKMHQKHKNVNFLEQMDKSRIDFHREGRKSLYVKLESLFASLGWNGKQCVLRMLCESAKLKRHQGSFFEEVLKATFTFRRTRKTTDLHKDYDGAHSATNDCQKLYPECQFEISEYQ